MNAEEITFFGGCVLIFLLLAVIIYFLAKGLPFRPHQEDVIPLIIIIAAPAFMTAICMTFDHSIVSPPAMTISKRGLQAICVALFAAQGTSIFLLTPAEEPRGFKGWARMVLLLLVVTVEVAVSFGLLVTSTWLITIGTFVS